VRLYTEAVVVSIISECLKAKKTPPTSFNGLPQTLNVRGHRSNGLSLHNGGGVMETADDRQNSVASSLITPLAQTLPSQINFYFTPSVISTKICARLEGLLG